MNYYTTLCLLSTAQYVQTDRYLESTVISWEINIIPYVCYREQNLKEQSFFTATSGKNLQYQWQKFTIHKSSDKM